eukprot:CAMPEP_0113940610 /NCGR_PEP_ID=MMETSP1339-20121228/6712_1 /TAXON_ID=94617 /ORGANISM="Fibrocapsa japonica" /LENGTH=204 /DNA_ID=CAMNT_0000944503 /DNA_START=4 /DNA_END=618 /DNA_ORIENTATION=+ /assembly_acc=CAM_ASM_000762
MAAWPDDIDVQGAGLGLIGGPWMSSPKVVRVDYGAAAGAALGVLARFSQHAHLQGLGCIAIANLLMKNELTADWLLGPLPAAIDGSPMIPEAAGEDGLSLILRTMELFPDTPSVVAAACWAVGAMAQQSAVLKAHIIERGGLEICENVLGVFSSTFPHQGVVKNAIFARSVLSSKEDGNRMGTSQGMDLELQLDYPPDSNCALQ